MGAETSVIRSVEVRVARVPLDQVTAFATRTVSARDYLLVSLTDVDGKEGHGFCYVGSAGGEVAASAVAKLLGPVVVGEDPFLVEKIWSRMYQEALLHGRTGSVMRALSALDIALWDHNARAVRLPLHRYLGGLHDETVPAYASGGYYLDRKTPEALGEELAGYVASGFRAVKMKVGRLSPAEEQARVAAARDAIGDGVLLMLDANNAWPDLPTALRTIQRFEAYDPYWIEEPFSPDDIDNHARLARATRIPVATGEIEAGRWRHKELLSRGAAGILQTDAAVCGGITEFRKIAATAASYEVPLAPHWFHDLHVHLVGATPGCRFVEFFPDDQVLNFRKLLTRQLTVRDGSLELPSGPGLGFEFDNATVERYALPETITTVRNGLTRWTSGEKNMATGNPGRGRSAVVMAGTRGLGRACAKAMLRSGHGVTLCGRDPTQLTETVTELDGEEGAVAGEQADFSRAEDVERVINSGTDRLGRLDVLVVNAGGPPPGDFGDVGLEEWDSAYELTLRSAIVAIRAAVPAMQQGGFGRILVLGSSSVRQPLRGLVLSNTFRPALAGLVKSLAVDLAPDGITINMVSPGRIDTERVRELDARKAERQGRDADEVRRTSEDAIPAGRYGEPTELAAMVNFLASSEASYVTGQSLLVDGGLAPTLP